MWNAVKLSKARNVCKQARPVRTQSVTRTGIFFIYFLLLLLLLLLFFGFFWFGLVWFVSFCFVLIPSGLASCLH